MKKSVLVLVIILASISVGSAFALTIRLAGDVTVDGTLTTGGSITSPTITSLQSQIDAVAGPVSPDADGDTLQGIDSIGFVQSLQSCPAGQLVVGFDSIGNEICSQISRVRNTSILLDSIQTDPQVITIGSDGFPIIAFDDNPDIKAIHCTNVTCDPSISPADSITTVVTGNIAGGNRFGLTIGGDGNPVVVNRTNPGNNLLLTHCTNVTCTSTTSEILDGPIVGTPTITTASDGFPIIAYSTDNAFPIVDMKIIHCTNEDCTSRTAPNIFDTVNNPFHFTIAIGSDNNPVISYSDGFPANDFFVTHCNTNSCDDVRTTTTLVDVVGENAGDLNSIAIGADGNPIIAYRHTDAIDDILKIIHCKTVICSTAAGVGGVVGSGFDPPVTLDIGGGGGSTDVARRLLMVIDNDGNPVIEYGHGGLNQIRIIQCTSIDCSTFDPPLIIDGGLETDSGSITVSSDGFPLVVYNDGTNGMTLLRIGGLTVP